MTSDHANTNRRKHTLAQPLVRQVHRTGGPRAWGLYARLLLASPSLGRTQALRGHSSGGRAGNPTTKWDFGYICTFLIRIRRASSSFSLRWWSTFGVDFNSSFCSSDARQTSKTEFDGRTRLLFCEFSKNKDLENTLKQFISMLQQVLQ